MSAFAKIGLSELDARSGREKATFILLVVMTVFLFMDQNLTAPNLSAIGEDLVIKKTEVEAKLAASDTTYKGLVAEREKHRASINDFEKRLADLKKSVTAEKPGIEKDHGAYVKAMITAASASWSQDDAARYAAAGRTQEKIDEVVTAAFNSYCDKIAGHASLWFWLLGGGVALFVGYLTDKFPRKLLLFATIIVGEIPCFLTGLVRTEGEFIAMRALTGIGIGAVLPLTYSLLGDLFSAKSRPSAVAWVGLAMGFGIAGGQLFAGFAGPNPEMGWRYPFMAVAIPNLLFAFIFLFVGKEPARGSGEGELQSALAAGAEYEERISLSDFKKIFSNKTNVLVFLQGIPGTVPWGFFFTFMVDFYHSNKGYSVPDATLLVTIFGGGAILGGFFGGLIGNKLYNKNPRYLPALCAVTTLGGMIPIFFIVNWKTADVTVWETALHLLGGLHITDFKELLTPILIGFVGGGIVTVTGGNVKAVLMDVNVPENRGTIFSIFNLTDDLGKGLGPFVIGSVLSVLFGRVLAYNIAISMWIFCGVIWIFLIKIFPKDEEALKHTLAQRAQGLRKA
ncbi:MAG: MFS transporter [Spirochaetia bacterium]|nr:MFS transporter [Spirochaetia bacterium]